MGLVSTVGLRFPRAGLALAALFVVLLAPAKSHAQTYTWNQAATGGMWNTVTNWLPSTGSPNAAGAVAILGNIATGPNSISLPAGGVTVGELRFEDVNAGSLTAAYTIAAGQSLTFNNSGSPSQINVAGFTVTNQTIAASIVIGGSQPLNIANNGAPGVTTLSISGGISATPSGSALVVGGSSSTAISGAINGTVNTLTKNGSGVLTLSGANTYTGGTFINGGTLRVSGDGQLGAAAGSVTLNGGAIEFTNAGFATSRGFVLGANGGTFFSAVGDGLLTNPTLTGVISGAGSLTLDGSLYVNLQQANTYSGPTVVNNAGLILSSPFLATSHGQLLNTSSVTINGYVGTVVGVLDLQNLLTANGNRVNNDAPITLNGGLLAFGTGLSGAVSETLGNLTVRGSGTLYLNQAGGSGTLTLGTLTRTDNFSTLYVGGPAKTGPSAPGLSIQVTFAGGGPPLSGGGTDQEIGIVPWIGGTRGAGGSPTGFASTLFTYDAGGLTALDDTQSDHFVQVTAGNDLNGLVPIPKNNAITGNPAPVNSDVTILSLVQNSATTTNSTISGSAILTVATGAIVNVNQLSFNGPTLNFGSTTGYWWLGNEAVISGASRITGTGGLVVGSNAGNSRNTLYMLNTTNPNSFSGGLYLNGTGRVAFNTSDAQLGAAGEKISFRGGSLRYIGSGSISLATAGNFRPLEMYGAGGGLISVESAAGVLTVPGLISGAEQLTVTGAGTLVLANSANTYAGGTTIGNSTLAIAGPGSLGTGNLTFGVTFTTTPPATFSGGTLRFDSTGTYGFSIRHAIGPATLNTNGNNVTLSGVISGNGPTLTKTGTGTLTLSAANTYTGNTNVNAGTLLMTNTGGLGVGYGNVTVAAGAAFGGTSTVGGTVTLNGSGRLIVGQPGGTGTLTLRGATSFTGAGNFETHLAGTTPGSGFAQLVITSGGSIALGSSTTLLLATLGYTPTPADMIFLINNQNAANGLTGTFAGLPQGATYTFANGTTAVISYTGNISSGLVTGGNDVVLHSFVPVPEPTTVLGIAGLALGGLMWRGRRRSETSAAAIA